MPRAIIRNLAGEDRTAKIVEVHEFIDHLVPARAAYHVWLVKIRSIVIRPRHKPGNGMALKHAFDFGKPRFPHVALLRHRMPVCEDARLRDGEDLVMLFRKVPEDVERLVERSEYNGTMN